MSYGAREIGTSISSFPSYRPRRRPDTSGFFCANG